MEGRNGRSRMDEVRGGARGVRQDVADDERVELGEQVRADAVLGHVLAEDDERADAAADTRAGNGLILHASEAAIGEQRGGDRGNRNLHVGRSRKASGG